MVLLSFLEGLESPEGRLPCLGFVWTSVVPDCLCSLSVAHEAWLRLAHAFHPRALLSVMGAEGPPSTKAWCVALAAPAGERVFAPPDLWDAMIPFCDLRQCWRERVVSEPLAGPDVDSLEATVSEFADAWPLVRREGDLAAVFAALRAGVARSPCAEGMECRCFQIVTE